MHFHIIFLNPDPTYLIFYPVHTRTTLINFWPNVDFEIHVQDTTNYR